VSLAAFGCGIAALDWKYIDGKAPKVDNRKFLLLVGEKDYSSADYMKLSGG
jgi:hypothetical protein